MGHKKSRKRKAAARLRAFLVDLISAILSGLITAAILKVLKW